MLTNLKQKKMTTIIFKKSKNRKNDKNLTIILFINKKKHAHMKLI